tara:strand:+ start:993 stop:1217 length:225 start_codon:yes stop_codon:yes gene_type:complete
MSDIKMSDIKMSYTFKDIEGELYFLCWSCESFMSDEELKESDGLCPKCRVELDMDESPYKEELEIINKLDKGDE